MGQRRRTGCWPGTSATRRRLGSLAAYADAFPGLGADALRTIVMTDERYVVRDRAAGDRAGRARPGLAVPLRRPLHRPRRRPGSVLRAVRSAADRGARRRRRRHLAGRLRPVRRPARRLGRARHHRRPRLGAVRVGRPAGDDLRPGRPARRVRPVRGHPRHLVRPHLAARPLVANRRSHLTQPIAYRLRF